MGEYDDMILPSGEHLSARAETFIKANPTARIVLSNEEQIYPRTVPISEQKIGMKPKGLWYGFGESWLEWIRMEMPHWEKKYAHFLKVIPYKILQISSYKELLAFEEEYGTDTALFSFQNQK